MANFQAKKSIANRERNVFEYYLSGTGSINESIDLDKDLYIKEVRLHLSDTATQELFDITVDSGKGVEYDVKLFNYNMAEDLDGNLGVVTDVVWRPTSLVRIDDEDVVAFTWTNTDALTWGLTVIVEG